MKRVRIIHDRERKNAIGGPLFAKGNGGRKPGIPNKVTTLLKDAIIMAANLVGEDRRGKDGLVGYLKWLAKNEPKTFGALMGRVIPLHVIGDMDHTHHVYVGKEEVKAALRERGIPITTIYPKRINAPTTETRQ
jgi:hypothetical protein